MGLILPDEFIPIAEEISIMPQIADWTMRQACHDLQFWKSKGVKDISISINLSNSQITHGNISQRLNHYIKTYGIELKEIEIELTETTMMLNRKQCADILQSLHDIGVIVAIDDFGTGYSSLNYLKSLPIDTLKIDQVFIHDIENDQNSQAIVKAIITLAHNLELNVVAEGVETEVQFEFLKENKCDYLQGFYFSKPKPQNEILELLK